MGLSESVLRPSILRVAHLPWMRRIVTKTRLGWSVAGRFVAGEALDDAMRVASELHRQQIASMLDHLGENVATDEQATAARDDYLATLDRIAAMPVLDAAISVKLTQLGLDDSVERCWNNLQPILDRAADDGTLVMIDMESHVYVDRTLEALAKAHRRNPHVGVAIQSYLQRSATDIFELPPGCRVRLVKGAYLEPPQIVYIDKEEVDRSYAQLFTTLLHRGHAIDVATHDPRLIEGVRRRVDSTGDGWSRVEFQMLYGVRRDLQVRLASQGYPVRVYIPYGTEWYPYLTRRLAERPANLWFFASNLVRTR